MYHLGHISDSYILLRYGDDKIHVKYMDLPELKDNKDIDIIQHGDDITIKSSNKQKLSYLANLLNLRETTESVYILHNPLYNHMRLINYEFDNQHFLLFQVTFMDIINTDILITAALDAVSDIDNIDINLLNNSVNKNNVNENDNDIYIDKRLYRNNDPTLYGGIHFDILVKYHIDIEHLTNKFFIKNNCFFFKPIDSTNINNDINYINSHFALNDL